MGERGILKIVWRCNVNNVDWLIVAMLKKWSKAGSHSVYVLFSLTHSLSLSVYVTVCLSVISMRL